MSSSSGSFDAGSVKGELNLDTTDFKKGFEEAHTHAETEGGHIREVLESIAEIATEVAGPAFARLGSEIQSALSGFSEGPIIGSLNLVGIALGNLREVVQETGEEFHQMGLEAEKAGVSVEFMDRLANVGRTANVGVEQLGIAFKMLAQSAEGAVTGESKEAAKAFDRLGISVTDLKKLLDNPEELFGRVQTAIGGMARETDRLAAAHDILGRAGANLIPVLAMSKQHFDAEADAMDRLSGGMNKSTAKMGSDLALLESYFSASFEGIERAAAKPVLEYLSRNIDVIEPKLERFTTEAINGLTIAYERLEQVGEILAPALAPFGDELVTVGGIVLETLKVVSDLSSYLIDTFKPAVDALGPAFGPIALALSPVLESLKILKALLEEIDALILKQRELSGLNEGVKSQIEGSTQEFNALRDRSALTPDQVKALRALGQERQEDIGKYDFEAALMVQQKMTEQLKGFAMSDDPQQQLANLEQRVHLALQSHPKLSPQTGIGVQNAIDAADAAVQGGDVNTAVEQERKALQLLGEGGQAAAVSINRLVPALDALDEHIRGIIDRATSTGPSAVAENIPPGQSSPATPAAAPGGHPGQTINIAVNFDHRDSVNQLAAKLHPVLRGIRHDLNSRFEGAAFEAAAATSMG